MELKPPGSRLTAAHALERYNALEFGDGDLNTLLRDELYQKYAQPLLVDGEPVYVDFPRMALEALDPQPGEVIADLCCGSGAFARMVAEACPEALVYGVDISKDSIERAKAIAAHANITNAQFIHGDARQLSDIFGAGEVGKVAINYALYLIPDVDKVIEEIYRILTIGGSGVALLRGAGNLSRQWEETHRVTEELGFEPQDSPYWNFDTAEAPERIGQKLSIVPFEPFDKLANPETRSIIRILAMGEEAWPIYSQTLTGNVMAAVLSQGGTPEVGPKARRLVEKKLFYRFHQQANASSGSYFTDTAEDSLVKFTKTV